MDREGAGDREATGRHAAGVPEIQIPTEGHEGLNVRKFRVLSLLMAKARVPFRGHFLGGPPWRRSMAVATAQQDGREEIPHIQGKEQRLRFAGAAMKRYPTSKVRETQVRQ